MVKTTPLPKRNSMHVSRHAAPIVRYGLGMATPSFDGQLTRANVGLAVRSGLVTEEEAQRYW